jgi:hypothetical protein
VCSGKTNQTTSSVLNKAGKKGEVLLAKYLEGLGYECYSSPDRYFPEWDIKAITPQGKTVLIEVKMDVTGMFLKNKRGFNFYIEMFNTKAMCPSGIFKSKAEKYAYFFLMPNNEYHLYVFNTRELRNLCCEETKMPITGNTIEQNACGWLVPNDSLVVLNHTLIKFDRDGNVYNTRNHTVNSHYSG